MKETDAKPSLRISHIVYGRTFENGRVKYLVDSTALVTSAQYPKKWYCGDGGPDVSRLRVLG